MTNESIPMLNIDADLIEPVQRLHQAQVYGRWLLVLCAWLSLGSWSLWQFRGDLVLLREDFTWVAIRYGLAFNLLPASALLFCIVLTVSAIVRQSLLMIRGLSPRDILLLELEVKRIQAIGPRHFLWQWIFRQ